MILKNLNNTYTPTQNVALAGPGCGDRSPTHSTHTHTSMHAWPTHPHTWVPRSPTSAPRPPVHACSAHPCMHVSALPPARTLCHLLVHMPHPRELALCHLHMRASTPTTDSAPPQPVCGSEKVGDHWCRLITIN